MYDLTSENTTTLVNLSALGENLDGTYTEMGDISNAYDFRYYTPWKFGLSLGHTIGNNLAIGATYEFSDYGASQNRVKDGSYDYYGNEDSYKDRVMKSNTEDVLKGVSTLKVGVEFKPVPELALRAGYNYVSPAYADNGVRDQTLDSYGVKYASTSDYVNWKATNRFTCGIGSKIGSMNLDLSYQYSATDGDFYRATNNRELQQIYKEIDKLEKSKLNVKKFSKRYEAYQPYAILAALLLFLEMLLRITVFRKLP